MGIKCFWAEPTDRVRRSLRRYADSCPKGSYCDATVPIDEVPVLWEEHHAMRVVPSSERPEQFAGDPRWPTCCSACGRTFSETDAYQVFTELLYRRGDTGEIVTLRKMPVGGIYNAWWNPRKGPDGRSLVCICPGGWPWSIDGRASNCTMKDDDVHRCWVRHGEPPLLTVDKNGHSCAAGAGSIVTPNWHGFLRNGELVS